ncbi:putative outer membrane efflux protein [Magnetofaba australis IT-1]|uniref:Putative outer membrane efflux protein n=1 Tax=Magnetofaba australis IT-1 TaxID=1434232 RepID=A0A1Y2K3M8_9PROT|nr:putative outer membrane efflux protein [Magnetofaba australis IT-1]
MTASGAARAFESESAAETDEAEAYATITLTQPLLDFGKRDALSAAAQLRAQAAQLSVGNAWDAAALDAARAYFDLYVSELTLQAANEAHALDYVRWERAKEREALGKSDAVVTAEWLSKVEASRTVYYGERDRNAQLRAQLAQLTGLPLDKELIRPPAAPEDKPPVLDWRRLADVAAQRNPQLQALNLRVQAQTQAAEAQRARPQLDAVAEFGRSTRTLRGNDRWAAGVQASWDLWDGGATDARREQALADAEALRAERDLLLKSLRLQVQEAAQKSAWAHQAILAAQAKKRWAEMQLLKRQTRYQQERVSDLGFAMVDLTRAEAQLVKAAGARYMASMTLAVLLGESPEAALKPDFLTRVAQMGAQTDAAPASESNSFTPPGGSGYGTHAQP